MQPDFESEGPRMIPAGYMAKRVSSKPEWLRAPQVKDIYSVAGCISKDFADYIKFWKHNGYWFFDSPQIIRTVARQQSIDLEGTTMFYYDVHKAEFDGEVWRPHAPESSFPTNIVMPPAKCLEGFDVVSFSVGTSAECSPLSCNSLAESISTNAHCLMDSFEDARASIESGLFNDSEPGPYRIFAVYTVPAESS